MLLYAVEMITQEGRDANFIYHQFYFSVVYSTCQVIVNFNLCLLLSTILLSFYISFLWSLFHAMRTLQSRMQDASVTSNELMCAVP